MGDGLFAIIGLGLSIISAGVGGLMGALTTSFRAGQRNAELATKKELECYVRVDTFNDHRMDVNDKINEMKLDVKNDLDEIKNRQSASEVQNEKRHSQLVQLIVDGSHIE